MTKGYLIIASVIDAETANAAIPQMKAIKHALTSEKELAVAFNSQIKNLNLLYDKVLKEYTAAPEGK